MYELIRKYRSYAEATFMPFKQNGKWYALCSLDYTATQLIDIETGQIIGGDKPHSAGFCPVEIYIPRYKEYKYKFTEEFLKGCPNPNKDPNFSYRVYDNECKTESEFLEGNLVKDNHSIPISLEFGFENFGFVAGCVWGDDTSWKIEYVDISEAHKGIIKRDARFGYIELPDHLNLKQAIEIEEDDSKVYGFKIATTSRFSPDGTKENDY